MGVIEYMEITQASVIFDSDWHTDNAGFRGLADARQVVLRALDVDIHIKLWEAEGHRTLMGQVLTQGPDEWASQAAVHLISEGHRINSANPDELGEFRFENVPDQTLSLQVDLPTLTLIGSLQGQTPQTPNKSEGVVHE